MGNPKTIDPDGDYLVAELAEAIQAIEQHQFPPLIIGEDDDKGDHSPAFFCPSCKQQIHENHLLAIHAGDRKTILYEPDNDDWEEQKIWGEPNSMSASDFGMFQKPLYYVHHICQAKVALPEGWVLGQA